MDDLRRRVLIVAYYFPPMGSSAVLRAAKFAKYLPDYGWEPLVLTATPSAYFAFDPTLLEELQQRQLQIYRTDGDGTPRWIQRRAAADRTLLLPTRRLHRLWLRWSQLRWIPDRAIRWKQQALELGLRLVREQAPSILFATAPPFTDFLIAAELAERSGLPFVVDYRDPWGGDPERWYPTPWHRARHRRLEQYVLTRAACITVVTRGLKEHLLRQYPALLTYEDVCILPHGYDPEDFAAFEGVQPPEDRLVISFVGVLKHGSPQTLLEALQRLVQQFPGVRRRIELRFVGLVRPEHERMVREYGLQDRVRLLGYVPHREAVRQMVESHVLWVELDSLVGSPAKLFEYFGARRTVLVCAPGNSFLRPYLTAEGIFWAEPGDVATLSRHLAEIYERWRAGTLPVPPEELRAQFDRRAITGELARLLGLHAAL